MTLLKELDKSSKELVAKRKIRVDSSKKIDERAECGYYLYVRRSSGGLLRKSVNISSLRDFPGGLMRDSSSVRWTIFRGDERDIIIVSMVRNPAQGKRYDAEFIKKFERINVAFSRARKLLIIVGSRKFLSEAGIIDLPDLDGDHSQDKLNFPVYREIIDTINFRGRIPYGKRYIGGVKWKKEVC